METEKRGPGRPSKPETTKIKLLRGYVPETPPDDRKVNAKDYAEGVRAMAAPGSVIEVSQAEAKTLVRSGVAELAFADEGLSWMTLAEKKELDAGKLRDALERRTAQIYATKMASKDLSRDVL